MPSTAAIYRAIKPDKFSSSLIAYKKTRRPPGNVSYVVDNLWEWVRPEGYPNRRYAGFASPTPELTCKAAGPDSRAYRVEFAGRYSLCQVKGYEDAKDHPEVKTLRRLLLKRSVRDGPATLLRARLASGDWTAALAGCLYPA